VLIIIFSMVFFEYDGHCTMPETPKSPKTLSLLFWGSSVDTGVREVFQGACRTFERANPSVSLNIVFYSVEQYKTKLPVLMAVNNPPDIFMTWSGAFLEPYVRAGKVLPLDEFLEKDYMWHRLFMQSAFDSLRYDGKIYAVPTVKAVAVLFYNKAIFKQLGLEEPSTYRELKNVIKHLRKAGITPLAFGNNEPWVGGMLAGQIVQRLGGESLFIDVKNKTVPWTHPAFLKAGKIIQEMDNLGAFPEAPNTIGYQDTIEMFYSGKAGMMLMGSWFIQYLTSQHSMAEDTIGVMAFPRFDDGTGSTSVWMGQTDMNLAISATCTQKDLAVAFAKWVTSPPCQRDLMLTAGLIPVTNIPVNDKQIRPELLSLIKLQMDMTSLFLFPDISLGGLAGQAFNNSIRKILDGEDPQNVFQTLEE